MNLATTIIPKSDQLNADDLMTGPRTITITAVEVGSSAEQPVTIRYEGDNGRPYKPCKSMRRVLVALYGDNGAAYVGKRITLYCDPSVKFGGDAVGGIRISHASDINAPVEISLTVTRGKRKPYRVEALPPEQTAPTMDAQQIRDVAATKNSADELRKWYQSLSAVTRAQLSATEWKQLAEQADGRAAA